MTDKNATIENTVLPAIMDSVSAAFETMVFLPVKCSDPVTDEDNMPTGSYSGSIGVTGSIDVSGEDLCGNVALIFPEGLAEKIFRSMMMMGDDEEVNVDEVKDSVGELANMAAGGAKAALADKGVCFKISLPTVIVGEKHSLRSPGNVTTYVIPVESDKGPFFLEVTFS